MAEATAEHNGYVDAKDIWDGAEDPCSSSSLNFMASSFSGSSIGSSQHQVLGGFHFHFHHTQKRKLRKEKNNS